MTTVQTTSARFHKVGRTRRIPICHPDRKHQAFGLCAPCYKQTPAQAELNRTRSVAYYHKHPEQIIEKNRKGALAKRYGLSQADYDRMYAAQGGVCAICGKPPKKKRLSVDHDHRTGKVRALLCAGCNGDLAILENPQQLAKSIAYLAGHGTVVDGVVFDTPLEMAA